VSGDATGHATPGSADSVSTAPEHGDDVVATELLGEAVRRGWTAPEVAIARRRVAGLLCLDTESSLEDAFLLGHYALVGGVTGWSLPAHLDQLAAIDADQVNGCARFMVDRLVVATAGGAGD
jgi:hypothetical protein